MTHFDQTAHPTITPEQWEVLVQAARDKEKLAALFHQDRDRLRRIVQAAMDQRVLGRVDASDVLQETFHEAYGRIDEYLSAPKVSLFVWLRFLAKQRLAMIHRQHMRTQSRDARREYSLHWASRTHGSTVQLAAQLAARLTTASETLSRKELKNEIQSALDKLPERSREILLLRHFEQLSNAEAADVLQIAPSAASNRYIRALESLKRLLPSSDRA